MASALRACALLLCLLAAVAGAQPRQVGEDFSREIKAAYLYKFANYVEWPAGAFAEADSPIVIGVVGDDALEAVLERVVVGKRIDGRALAVRRLAQGDSPAGVHILFVGQLAAGRLSGLRAATSGRPMLVVSDGRQGDTLASMVQFVVVDQRLRFEVALAPVTASGLKLSALMLTAAHKVSKEGQ